MTLGEYTTKEKDLQKGISRIPLELARLSDEDLVNLDQFKGGSSSGSNSEKYEYESLMSRAESIGMPTIEYTDELEQNILHRGRAYMASKNSNSLITSDDSSEEVIGSPGKTRTQSLYCRSSECE